MKKFYISPVFFNNNKHICELCFERKKCTIYNIGEENSYFFLFSICDECIDDKKHIKLKYSLMLL